MLLWTLDLGGAVPGKAIQRTTYAVGVIGTDERNLIQAANVIVLAQEALGRYLIQIERLGALEWRLLFATETFHHEIRKSQIEYVIGADHDATTAAIDAYLPVLEARNWTATEVFQLSDQMAVIHAIRRVAV